MNLIYLMHEWFLDTCYLSNMTTISEHPNVKKILEHKPEDILSYSRYLLNNDQPYGGWNIFMIVYLVYKLLNREEELTLNPEIRGKWEPIRDFYLAKLNDYLREENEISVD